MRKRTCPYSTGSPFSAQTSRTVPPAILRRPGPLLGQHPIVHDLIVGGENEGQHYAQMHDVENDEIAKLLSPLIYDADSSQLSGIKEVLDGKNLVFKGPPGTG
jgi:hypothetical protein